MSMSKRLENQRAKVEAARNALKTKKGKEKKAAEKELKKLEDKLRVMEDEENIKQKLAEEARAERVSNAVMAREEKLSRICDGDFSWADEIQFDDEGRVKNCLQNVSVVVANHKRFGANIRKNMFTGDIEWNNNPMTDELETQLYFEVYALTDIDKKQWVHDSIVECARKNRYHPILEKVDGLVWDGKERFQDFFIKTVGAEDTPLTRELSFRWLCAMYRRIKYPGCYFDAYLAVSDNTQGTGKSTVFQMLTEGLGIKKGDGDTVVFTTVNAQPNLSDRDMAMVINASAIVQFDENKNGKTAEIEEFKSFITQRNFKVRLPYGHYVESYKVHCVYAMSTNDEKYLRDNTTNYERRAWVLRCKGKAGRTDEEWRALIPDDTVQQIWAEAKWWDEHQEDAYEKYGWKINGSNIHNLTPEGKEALMAVQAEVKTMDDDTDVVNAIETMFTQNYTQLTFTTATAFEEDHDKWANRDANWNCKITRIPLKWAHGYAQKLAKRKFSLRYFDQLMQSPNVKNLIGDWVKKDHVRYKNTKVTCYVLNGVADESDDETTLETAEKTQKNTKKIAEKPRKNSVFLAENCDFSKDGLVKNWGDSDDFDIDL